MTGGGATASSSFRLVERLRIGFRSYAPSIAYESLAGSFEFSCRGTPDGSSLPRLGAFTLPTRRDRLVFADADASRPPMDYIENRTFDELTIGERNSFARALTPEDFERFADAAGNSIPTRSNRVW